MQNIDVDGPCRGKDKGIDNAGEVALEKWAFFNKNLARSGSKR